MIITCKFDGYKHISQKERYPLRFQDRSILQGLMSNLLCQCQPQVDLDNNAGRLPLIYY